MNRRLKRLELLKNKSDSDIKIKEIRSLLDRKDYVKANELINEILDESPKDDQAMALSSFVSAKFGYVDFAIESLLKAIDVNPFNEYALTLLARIYAEKQDYDNAKKYYLKANKINNGNVDVYKGMANVCLSLKKDDEAYEFARAAVVHVPNNAEAHYVFADVLRQKGLLDDAGLHYEKAVELDSGSRSAMLGCAITAFSKGNFKQSVELYRKIPDYKDEPRILWNYSLALLACGEFKEGYSIYKYGFPCKTRAPNRMMSMKKPEWKGESLKGKTLLIWREQGVGDELLFSYFYKEVIRGAGKVIIECEKRLVSLFKKTFKDAEVRAQSCSVEEIKKDGDVVYKELMEDYDYHIPAMQIPGVLYDCPQQIPFNKGFLNIDENLKQKWKQRLSNLKGLKVGIMWRSGNVKRARGLEYAVVEDLKKTFSVKDVSFVNLMYSECEEEKQYIKENYGAILHEWEDLNLKDDFEDVFALIDGLDLVVSPGTTVINMAGLINKPAILFGRMYSWTFYGQKQSPIVPSIKVVLKNKWNDDNIKLDEDIANMIEKFKQEKKL
ncbi:MAG: formate-dependent nitrite reductase complex subunit NrfG [Alphaproteobacteria bacterium ADurb.Bin438]|nr:MAG: formate-dependent nitrite reductase complex subunit NrfG [Alphaproteobacteria bacterium ADurb.Bin438]